MINPERIPPDNVIKCNEQLSAACKLYCQWYNTGHPAISGSNMAYELVSYVRQALAELNKKEIIH
jgi:hypothetical protein